MASNGTFSFVPASGVTGTVTFTYRETDGASRTSTAQVTINVANLAPDFTTTTYNTAVVVAVQGHPPQRPAAQRGTASRGQEKLK